MNTELVHTLTGTFEAHAQQAENGVEFWLARDLQHLLGYTEWRNFTAVVSKAKLRARFRITRSPTILLMSTKWSISVRVVSARWMTSCSPATPSDEL